MAKDRGGPPDSTSIQKEGWLSLQGSQGQARPVRGVLTNSSLILYSTTTKKRAAGPKVPAYSAMSAASLADGTLFSNDSMTSLPAADHNVVIQHRTIEKSHPGADDSLNYEAVAHHLLFSREEILSYRALVLTTNVTEVTNSLCAYIELLLNRSLGGALSGAAPPLCPPIERRLVSYAEAILKFPSIILNPAVLTSVVRLATLLGALDTQLAEHLKNKLASAQETAQKKLQLTFTPNMDPSGPDTSPTSPPVTNSHWATRLLNVAGKGRLLPVSFFLEEGFVEEFTDQVVAFHRRVWRHWSPTTDISLLFHSPQSSGFWKINPLVFDADLPHFLSTLAMSHILETGLDDDTRARLIEKWLTVAARLRQRGDSVGWVAILLTLYDASILRLRSAWTKVDQAKIAQLAHGWGFEAFEVSKRSKIPFMEKRAFRTDMEDMGRLVAKHDCVPYFGDAIVHDVIPVSRDIGLRQLDRLEAIIAGWDAYVASVNDEVASVTIPEDPAYQCLFAVWAQQQSNTAPIDRVSASLSIQPKLLGYYLPHFYQQVLPLTSGAMLPVLFTALIPNFRLFPRSTLILASQPKQSHKPRTVLRRSSSFPPAGPPQTTGVSELDSGAREQMENTASAHVLGQVIRDLLNVGTDTYDTHLGIVFKSFPQDDRVDSRSSRTSSIIETLNKRSSRAGKHVVVKSASMVRLVDVLVLGAGIFGHNLILDSEAHIATLLATFRSFCSPAEMLNMLQVRVRCARGASRVLHEQMQQNGSYSGWKQIWRISESDDKVDTISVRVISMIIAMLQIWISDYFFDFMDDRYVLDAGTTLMATLRQEMSVGGYPDNVVAQCRRMTGAFSRHQFSIDRREKHTPSWIPLVFDQERQDAYRKSQCIPPELPVTSLEHDGGLAHINGMVDELDTIVADAFSRITMVDWMKLFEVLEQQTTTKLGLFNYTAIAHATESDVVVHNVYYWLQTLQAPNSKTRVLDELPEPIVALVRLFSSLVSYFAAQVADPSLAHAHERRERMTYILKMLGVLRARMQFFNLSLDLDEQNSQHIPSFLERAIASSILLPESRAYAASWQAAGAEVARMFPQAPGFSTPAGATETLPNSRFIFVPQVPTRQGRPVTVCVGWIIERLLEIVCCVPNTSVENPDLINFDKRRYAYNLIKNMSSEFQSAEPICTSQDIIKKYFFLFGEPARTAAVPRPLIERRAHKESLMREGKTRSKVFIDIVSQEIEKIKNESRMHERIERATANYTGPPNSQSFYGLPVSQSSTSLYSKRLSRLIPSASTVDVASILEAPQGQQGSGGTSGSGGGHVGPTNTAHAQGNVSSPHPASPSKTLSSHPKKSRFGGLLRAVRPLSVLGGGSGSLSGGSASSASSIFHGSQGSQSGTLYNHQTGSSSSVQSNSDDTIAQENPWVKDDALDLSALPTLDEYTAEDWQALSQIEIVNFSNVQLCAHSSFAINHRSGAKPQTQIFRAPTSQDAREWSEISTSIMRDRLLESTRVFGVPLDIVCARERRNVPMFLETLLSQIEDRGLEEVGIYRISGSLAAVNSIKQWFDQGNSHCKPNDPKWSDINAIAGCIKLYLRELPKPLMTDELLQDFMSVIGPQGVDIDMLQSVIRQLPSPNYHVLDRISKHLKLIVDHSDYNKMNVQNIAIVFSVNFLPPVAMSQMGGMQQLVSTLVLQRDSVFA